VLYFEPRTREREPHVSFRNGSICGARGVKWVQALGSRIERGDGWYVGKCDTAGLKLARNILTISKRSGSVVRSSVGGP